MPIRGSFWIATVWALLCLFHPLSPLAATDPPPSGQNLDEILAREEPPVVGLALSGGGARGFAHIGVLMALEELGIQPARLAGTSMGALIGALAACGYRASEIEEILVDVDWNDLYRDQAPRSRTALLERADSGRYLISLPADGFHVQVPTGVSDGEKIAQLLSRLTVGVAGARFDELPIPYRAVATDLVTGERVALGGGDLSEAVRASLAVPLVFIPVEIGGRLLVDGGLSDNLPIDVVEEMGGELLIGSDVTSALHPREKLNNPLGVMDQALSLQVVANALRMREKAHLVLAPPMTDMTLSDFDRSHEIIRAGYEAARADPVLRRIAAALATRPPPPTPIRPPLIIGGLRVEGTDRFSGKKLRRVEESLTLRPLSPADLQGATEEVFSGLYFPKIRYRLVRNQDRPADLVMQVEETSTDEFNFSGRVDDKYGALGLVNLTLRGLGGWDHRTSLDFQIGTFSRFGAEVLSPEVPGNALFFRSRALWSNDFQYGYDVEGDQSEYVDRRWGGEVAVGNTFQNLGAVSLGYRLTSVDFRRDAGEEVLTPFEGTISALFLESELDSLDRSEIPDRGRRIRFQFEAARSRLGGDLDFDRTLLDYEGYHTWRDRHTLTTALRFSTSFEDQLPESEQSRLGGIDYLWGHKREELRGNHVAAVGAGYRFLLADLGSAFISRLYLEVGADGANAWVERELGGGLILDGYLSFQARSWIGPLRVNLGWSEGGDTNLTFVLGHSF